MFFLTRPSPDAIERFLHAARGLPLSYQPVGLAGQSPSGFSVDDIATVVGSGEQAFVRAMTALMDWKHFELGWVDVFPTRASIAPGSVVAVLVRHAGVWSLNACRVVYALDDRSGTEFGFAYGTLSDHGESGEEIFKVTFEPKSGNVSYMIRAVSRPRAALARLGYPLTRVFQARFRRDSTRAMARAIATH